MAYDDQQIDKNLRATAFQAIQYAQTAIRWKPGKDTQHLNKRIRLRHLPVNTTLIEYETIITTILNKNEARVYIFFYNRTPYPTIVTTIQGKTWLVMIRLDGVMETAFPPDDPATYLAEPAFTYIGQLKELQNE